MPKRRLKAADGHRAQAAAAPVDTAHRRRHPPVDRLLWVGAALAMLGAVDSAYLAWVKLAHTQPFCSGLGDCETVNSSIYSVVNGVPVAVLGLGAYLAIGALFVAGARLPALQNYASLAIFGLALTGTLYSAYLTYVELFVIHAICPYCVASAMIITGLLIVSVVRLMRGSLAAPDAH